MPGKKILVHWYENIRPRRCEMIAAWPGVGDVALILADYVRGKLGAIEVADIDPTAFFNATGVLVRDNVIEEPQFPQSKFYYWKNPGRGKDLIIFIGDEQPASKSYELANLVLGVAKELKVRRVYTFAAALVKIHHSEQPRVWAAATDEKLLKEATKHDVVLRGTVQIAGLNGLFLGVAKERGMPGICLLGESPMYATRIPNPKAALAIAKVFAGLFGASIDLAELKVEAEKAEVEMSKITAEAMGHFIENFTTPIWEEGQPEDQEEG
ncbi:MAG: PAC2 family protein [Chloroflexota bacterium]